jgi:surface antigen
MFPKPVILLLASLLALVACQNDNWGTDQTVGTLGGAAAGGAVGSQFGKGSGNAAMTGLGVLLGGWAGNEIGAEMDNNDRMKDRQAEQRAYTAPVGQQVTWNNPDTGHSGTILPVHDGYAPTGAYCRDFQQTILIDGQQRQGYGKACQQPDGSWKIVK